MATRILMGASAIFMAVLGLAATFVPQEILSVAGGPTNGIAMLIVQVTGALYVGFAMLDWMAQGLLIGGIYGRPLSIANLAHFMIAALALGKAVATGQHHPAVVGAAAVYALFAVLFALVFLGHPLMVGAPKK
jgi:hypothetical protein